MTDIIARMLAANANNAISEKKYSTNDYPELFNFSQLTWKEISNICRTSDPSMYWKVGDVKTLTYPAMTVTDYVTFKEYNSAFTSFSFGIPNIWDRSVGGQVDGYIESVDTAKFIAAIEGEGEYKLWSNKSTPIVKLLKRRPGTTLFDEYKSCSSLAELESIYGIKIVTNDYYTASPTGFHTGYGTITVVHKTINIPEKNYLTMILGFNHDEVTNVANYGKQKAGLSLCIGASRSVVQNAPPIHWDDAVIPNSYDCCFYKDASGNVKQFPFITADATHIMSPYIVGGDLDYSQIALQKAINEMLNGIDELKDIIVSVDKRTAEGNLNETLNYYPSTITSCKVFLPSNYEINGMLDTYDLSNGAKKEVPAQEGEWYEFFKRGNSRFIWNQSLIEGREKEYDNKYWTRSRIKQNTSAETLAYKGASYLRCNDNPNVEVDRDAFSINKATFIKKLISTTEYSYVHNIFEVMQGSDETKYSLYVIGIEAPIPIEEDLTESTLQNWGITLVNFDKQAAFNIYHGTQVGYGPKVGTGNTKGHILPCFCL